MLIVSKNDDEVLVRVEGVSKKFCRSLKKSLWYGVCDIASELNPFGRNAGQSNEYNYLTTIERHGGRENEQLKVGPKGEGVGRTESKDTESTERVAGGNQRADSGEFLESHSQAGLQMDSEKLAAIRAANASTSSGDQSGLRSESAKISEICGKKSDAPDGAGLRPGEFWAVKDVSFELRRGELRSLGRSEKEISKKCLGATKVPDTGRRRHQCLGLIGHNGAGTRAAGQPRGRLPQAARRVNRGAGVHRERLPQGSSEGEAGWENLRIKRRGKA